MTATTNNWVARDRKLGIEKENGIFFVPSAEEIYRQLIESEGLKKLEVGDDIITLSSTPVRVIGRLRRSFEEERIVARIDLDGVAGDAIVALPVSFQYDQLIVDQTWFPIESNLIAEWEETKSLVDIPADGALSLAQLLKLKKLRLEYIEIIDETEIVSGLGPESINKLADAPQGFVGSLFLYQSIGVRWMRSIAASDCGGVLADEMGLGKTVQVAALLLGEVNNGARPHLIVAPGTLLENWRRELKRFCPTLAVHVHQGPRRSVRVDAISQVDIVISSYDTVVQDVALFTSVAWQLVVLDEAQSIKNMGATRSKIMKRLPKRCGIAVTGTPVENRLSDLWSIFDFCYRGYLGSYSSFIRDFSNTPDGGERLQPLISPLILRRKISDVATELPARIVIPQPLRMSAEWAREYEILRKQAEDAAAASCALSVLTRLRQFCASPTLLEAYRTDGREFAKTTRLRELLEEIVASRGKVIVFSSYKSVLNMICDDSIARFGIFAKKIDGDIDIANRQGIVDEFSANQGAALLAVNPRAGGTGLNVTAANHVIHYNLEWNPAVEDQASARAHRRGQTRPVTIHRLFFIDTVEDIINRRLDEKRQLGRAAVVGHSGDVDDIIAAIRLSPMG